MLRLIEKFFAMHADILDLNKTIELDGMVFVW